VIRAQHRHLAASLYIQTYPPLPTSTTPRDAAAVEAFQASSQPVVVRPVRCKLGIAIPICMGRPRLRDVIPVPYFYCR
jgi:hypothetical protein